MPKSCMNRRRASLRSISTPPAPKPPAPKPGAAPCCRSRVAEAVVLRPAARVLEHLVGLGGLAELLGRLGVVLVAVGVVLHRQLAVGLLDLGLGGVAGEPEDLVVVALGRHQPRSLRHDDAARPQHHVAQGVALLHTAHRWPAGHLVRPAPGRRPRAAPGRTRPALGLDGRTPGDRAGSAGSSGRSCSTPWRNDCSDASASSAAPASGGVLQGAVEVVEDVEQGTQQVRLGEPAAVDHLAPGRACAGSPSRRRCAAGGRDARPGPLEADDLGLGIDGRVRLSGRDSRPSARRPPRSGSHRHPRRPSAGVLLAHLVMMLLSSGCSGSHTASMPLSAR